MVSSASSNAMKKGGVPTRANSAVPNKPRKVWGGAMPRPPTACGSGSAPRPNTAEIVAPPRPNTAEGGAPPRPNTAEDGAPPRPNTAEAGAPPRPNTAEAGAPPRPNTAEAGAPPRPNTAAAGGVTLPRPTPNTATSTAGGVPGPRPATAERPSTSVGGSVPRVTATTADRNKNQPGQSGGLSSSFQRSQRGVTPPVSGAKGRQQPDSGSKGHRRQPSPMMESTSTRSHDFRTGDIVLNLTAEEELFILESLQSGNWDSSRGIEQFVDRETGHLRQVKHPSVAERRVKSARMNLNDAFTAISLEGTYAERTPSASSHDSDDDPQAASTPTVVGNGHQEKREFNIFDGYPEPHYVTPSYLVKMNKIMKLRDNYEHWAHKATTTVIEAEVEGLFPPERIMSTLEEVNGLVEDLKKFSKTGTKSEHMKLLVPGSETTKPQTVINCVVEKQEDFIKAVHHISNLARKVHAGLEEDKDLEPGLLEQFKKFKEGVDEMEAKVEGREELINQFKKNMKILDDLNANLRGSGDA